MGAEYQLPVEMVSLSVLKFDHVTVKIHMENYR